MAKAILEGGRGLDKVINVLHVFESEISLFLNNETLAQLGLL